MKSATSPQQRLGLQQQVRDKLSMLQIALVLLVATVCLPADQVQMQNGDRYFGKVLSLNTNTLVMHSDLLGAVRLPREKVAFITLGSTATNFVRGGPTPNLQSAPATNTIFDLSTSLRQLQANTNFIRQVQAQFLGDAGPEANKKYNEMVGGLMSGKLSMNDLRTEAKSAADQLRELKRDLGEDAGWALDGYLAILENFLQETGPSPAGTVTNVSGASPKPKPRPVQNEE